MAVIGSQFDLIKVQRKEIFLNTKIRLESMFGIAPEAFDAVDMGVPWELLCVYRQPHEPHAGKLQHKYASHRCSKNVRILRTTC